MAPWWPDCPLHFQQVVLLVLDRKDDIVTEPSNWQGQNCICFIIVYDEETHVALKGHEGKGTGEIIVQYSRLFVCKGGKAEYICI